MRDKAAQLVKNEERSRQEYTNANEEVNMNEEANNAVGMTTTGAQERNQQESQQKSVGHEICINEEANNANHTSSVEHTNIPISISYASTETEQLHQQEIHNIESEEYPGELNNNVNDFLPNESDFRWDEVNGSVFCQNIDRAYEEIVHWKRNVLLLPSGKLGKSFVRELARL